MKPIDAISYTIFVKLETASPVSTLFSMEFILGVVNSRSIH